VTHKWALCLDYQSTTYCIFLDYAKAFDSVPQDYLLLKFNTIGITGSLTERIFDGLSPTGGHQWKLPWLAACLFALQGSVLGPLLFLLCIKWLILHEAISHSELSVYASNVAFLNFREICSSSDCDKLQEDLNGVCLWSDRWQLHLSPPKYEALWISNKRAPITTTYCLIIIIIIIIIIQEIDKALGL